MPPDLLLNQLRPFSAQSAKRDPPLTPCLALLSLSRACPENSRLSTPAVTFVLQNFLPGSPLVPHNLVEARTAVLVTAWQSYTCARTASHSSEELFPKSVALKSPPFLLSTCSQPIALAPAL